MQPTQFHSTASRAALIARLSSLSKPTLTTTHTMSPHTTPIPTPAPERQTTPTPLPEPIIDLTHEDNVKNYLISLGSSPKTENIRLIGPAGCGKTSIGQWLAQQTNKSLLIMDCAIIREPRDWFGFRTILEGKITWQDTAFVRTVTSGNAVIILDELNRAPSSVLNGLMPLLDHRRTTWCEERGTPISCGPNLTFFATTNIGSRYVGASPIDLALSDRFSRAIEVTYLSLPEETALLQRRIPNLTPIQAQHLSDIASTTRNKANGYEPISTRELLAAASDLSLYGEHSLRHTILSKIQDHSKRAALATIFSGKFPGIINNTTTPALTQESPF